MKNWIVLLSVSILVSCGQTYAPSGKAPVAGTPLSFSAVTVTNGKATGLTVSWGAASDEDTSTSSLTYKLVLDTNSSANLDSVIEAVIKSGGELAMDWTAGATNFVMTNIDGNRSYYFNVVVKDASGNMSIYTPRRLGELSGTAGFYYLYTNYPAIGVTLSNSSLVYSNSGPSNYYHIRSIYAGTYKMFANIFVIGLSSGIGTCSLSTNGSGWFSLSSSSNFRSWYVAVPTVISNVYLTIADDESQTYDFFLYGY